MFDGKSSVTIVTPYRGEGDACEFVAVTEGTLYVVKWIKFADKMKC